MRTHVTVRACSRSDPLQQQKEQVPRLIVVGWLTEDLLRRQLVGCWGAANAPAPLGFGHAQTAPVAFGGSSGSKLRLASWLRSSKVGLEHLRSGPHALRWPACLRLLRRLGALRTSACLVSRSDSLRLRVRTDSTEGAQHAAGPKVKFKVLQCSVNLAEEQNEYGTLEHLASRT